VSKFGCGENLFSRSDANKFTLSRFDEAIHFLDFLVTELFTWNITLNFRLLGIEIVHF